MTIPTLLMLFKSHSLSNKTPVKIPRKVFYKLTTIDDIFCQRCTCKSCRKGAHYGYNCPPQISIISNLEPCYNQNLNEILQNLQSLQQQSFLGTCQQCGCNEYDRVCFYCTVGNGTQIKFSTPYSSNDSPNFANHPPQPQYETNICELCGNDAHFGYDCPPQVPFIYNQDPCFDQNFDNNFPQTSPSFPQQCLCCENCGGPHATFQCQAISQDFYNSNSFGFVQSQTPQFPINYPPQETSKEILQAQEDLMEAIQAFLKEYDHIPPNEKCMALLLAEERFRKIKQTMEEEQNQPGVMQELLLKLMDDLQILKSQQEKKEMAAQSFIPYWNFSMIDDEEARDNFLKDVYTFLKKFSRISFGVMPKVLSIAWERFDEIKDALTDKQYQQEDIQELMSKLLEDVRNIREELSEYINCPSWNRPTFYDNDDNEYTIIYSKPKAITPYLPIEEPDNSLSMGDEHLDIIPSVENLVPIPSEFEGIFDDTCDVPECDETSPTFTTFLNPLFDSNDDFNSSDDELLSDEDSNLIESLLNRDILIDSSPKFDYLLEEFSDLIPPGIEKADFDLEEEIRLVENLSYVNSYPRPPEELNVEISDMILESLSPPLIPVEDRDIRFLEELLSNNSLPFPENESSNFDLYDVPLSPRPPPEPPDVKICLNFEPDTTMKNDIFELNEDECFNPGGGEINVEVDNSFTFVTWIFLPYLTYPEVSPLLSSTKNEDTIFDPGIST
ncbi:hypothetical protein Tco_1468561 [Tanacetum coccineum]